MSKEDGGSAFPFPAHEAGTILYRPETGMTLRDYFAGQALPDLCAHRFSEDQLREAAKKEPELAKKKSITVADFVAFIAYRYADAMLKARKEPPCK